jgi:regulator of sigma E protease
MNIIIVIIILGVLVFVHELGHFLFAKWTNTRVDEFAIGFKPTIFSKKIGETTYALNAIPFGGYVKIPGEDPDDMESRLDPKSLYHKSKLQKACILSGGILFNMIFAWMLIVGMFMTGIPVGPQTAEKYSEHVTVTVDGEQTMTTLRAPVSVAITEGSLVLARITRDTVTSFAGLIGGIFNGTSKIDQLTGPVGLGSVVHDAKQGGLIQIIFLTAFISINLAILNLVPFPALDGGRLLVLLVESITRKTIPVRILQWVNGIGFILLILLMVAVTVSDISRLIG